MLNVSVESSLISSDKLKNSIGYLSEAIANIFRKYFKSYSDKSTQTESLLNLSVMPIDVVSLIIEKSEYKEKLILRKVSKPMRSLVDKSKPACTALSVWCGDDLIFCRYNSQTVLYNTVICNLDPKTIVQVVRDDYEIVAFDDLKWTLKNPKLQLDTLCYIHLYDEDDDGWIHWLNVIYISVKKMIKPMEDPFAVIDNKMETMLKSLNHQVSFKEIRFGCTHTSTILAILPYLKPGVLETICLATRVNDSDTTLDQNIGQISSLDQWKQAQQLKLSNINPINLMEYTTHFKRFDMYLMKIEEAHFISLRNHFSVQNNFEYCSICIGCILDTDSLAVAFGVPAPPNEQAQIVRHHSIPNSDYHLECMYFEEETHERITIEKKKISPS